MDPTDIDATGNGNENENDDLELHTEGVVGITAQMLKDDKDDADCINQSVFLRDECLSDPLPSVKVNFYENIMTLVAMVAYNELIKKQDGNASSLNFTMYKLFHDCLKSIPANESSFGGDYGFLRCLNKIPRNLRDPDDTLIVFPPGFMEFLQDFKNKDPSAGTHILIK